jgi:hypothetical protein
LVEETNPARPRFGDIAVRRGLVPPQVVDECLHIQLALRKMGLKTCMGAIMHDRGYLSLGEIGKILGEQTDGQVTCAIRGYEVFECVATTPSGRTYRGKHEKLGRMVAIRALSPEISRDRTARDAVFSAAKTIAKLEHPNLVRLLGAGEAHGYSYLVMEWVDGASAEAEVKKDGPHRGARPQGRRPGRGRARLREPEGLGPPRCAARERAGRAERAREARRARPQDGGPG